MNAHIVENWQADGFDVWLFERRAAATVLLRFDDGRPRWEETPQNSQPDPTLTIPRDALEALLAAAEKHVPATDATVDALRDTRTTRDRLLALIEKRGLR